MREREASACVIMLSVKQGSHWYNFKTFGMAQPGFEPKTFLFTRPTRNDDILSHRDDILSRFNYNISRSDEITSHFDDRLSRRDDIQSR